MKRHRGYEKSKIRELHLPPLIPHIMFHWKVHKLNATKILCITFCSVMLSLLITVLLKHALQCCETVTPECIIYDISKQRYWNILYRVLQSCVPEQVLFYHTECCMFRKTVYQNTFSFTIQSVVCFAKLCTRTPFILPYRVLYVLQSCRTRTHFTVQGHYGVVRLWYQSVLYRVLQSCDTRTYFTECYEALVPGRLIQCWETVTSECTAYDGNPWRQKMLNKVLWICDQNTQWRVFQNSCTRI
jgi:hypothetical protein